MRKYLLVDDNRPLAENLAEILRDRGEEVLVACRGEDALACVRGHRFDALLTDMRMPHMGGAELVHAIRRLDPGLPAIAITAYTGEENLRTARNEGLLAVLSKPVPLPRLFDLLQSAKRHGTVALIEDDEALSDNLVEALRARGFTAITATSVVETDRLGEVAPFVALVDLKVPGGSPGAAMERLAARFPGIPMVVITALSDTHPPQPPRAIFRKPFDTEALLRLVEQLYADRVAR